MADGEMIVAEGVVIGITIVVAAVVALGIGGKWLGCTDAGVAV